jgi:hypothetical protein
MLFIIFFLFIISLVIEVRGSPAISGATRVVHGVQIHKSCLKLFLVYESVSLVRNLFICFILSEKGSLLPLINVSILTTP